MSDSLPNASGIYKITCTANKKIYIGSAINLRTRQSQHFSALRKDKHCNAYMQHAWNKYGEQSFTFDVLELVLPISLTAREQYWLNKLKPFRKKGFNIAPEAGSTLGRKMTREAREKSSQSSTGKKMSSEAIEKIRQARLGKPGTRLGMKNSPEQNERIRQSSLGKKMSPEACEKMSKAQIARHARKREVDGEEREAG